MAIDSGIPMSVLKTEDEDDLIAMLRVVRDRREAAADARDFGSDSIPWDA